MIREADANETSGEDGLALPGSLVGEFHLRIPKFEPEIILSNMLSIVSAELEYHGEWCALKSPSIKVYFVIIDDLGKEGNLLRKSLLGDI